MQYFLATSTINDKPGKICHIFHRCTQMPSVLPIYPGACGIQLQIHSDFFLSTCCIRMWSQLKSDLVLRMSHFSTAGFCTTSKTYSKTEKSKSVSKHQHQTVAFFLLYRLVSVYLIQWVSCKCVFFNLICLFVLTFPSSVFWGYDIELMWFNV